MSRPKSFQDLFLVEARELYSAEEQVTEAFPTLVEAASSDELRAAIETELEQTRTHIQRLDEVFTLLDEVPGGQHCSVMAAILEETKSALDEEDVAPSMDGSIVASAQRVAHFEIAAYGSLVAAATTLGAEEITAILRRTLEDKKTADETLRFLTDGDVYARAAV